MVKKPKTYQPFLQLCPFKMLPKKQFLFFAQVLSHKESGSAALVTCNNPVLYIQPHWVQWVLFTWVKVADFMNLVNILVTEISPVSFPQAHKPISYSITEMRTGLAVRFTWSGGTVAFAFSSWHGREAVVLCCEERTSSLAGESRRELKAAEGQCTPLLQACSITGHEQRESCSPEHMSLGKGVSVSSGRLFCLALPLRRTPGKCFSPAG